MFVVLQYEGRWSIELINDRNTPVKSFAWSHDGRMALICYQVSRMALICYQVSRMALICYQVRVNRTTNYPVYFRIFSVYFHLLIKQSRQKRRKIPYKRNKV